jgi:hypothetical protein
MLLPARVTVGYYTSEPVTRLQPFWASPAHTEMGPDVPAPFRVIFAYCCSWSRKVSAVMAKSGELKTL